MTRAADIAERAAAHDVTQCAIGAAVRRLRGRDLSARTPLDVSLAATLTEFAVAAARFALIDEGMDLAVIAVGQEGWRARLADENHRRLHELCAMGPFIDRSVGKLDERKKKGRAHLLPIRPFLREAFLHVSNSVTKVARMVAAGHDPAWLVTAMPTEPHYQAPPASQRPTAG